MAKFYQRYLPPSADNVVQYGYRGTNYTVNGQFYYTGNNVEQVGNYQYTCAASRCGAGMAPIAVDSLFEPSLNISPYDTAGSRFSGEYQAGTFNSYGTYKDANNYWTFKNGTCIGPLTFSVVTSSAVPCLTGCVSSFTDQSATYDNYRVVGAVCTTCYYYCNNWQVVEHPSGTYNCFIPHTSMKTWAIACGGCVPGCITNCLVTYEQTNGTACCPIYAGQPYATTMAACSYGCWSCYNNGTAVSDPFNVFNATATLGDKFYFGSTENGQWCLCYSLGQSNTAKINTIFGATFLYGSTTAAIEMGSRIFVAAAPPYYLYYHFDSTTGGIQGSDTVASGLAGTRLKLKLFNQNTNLTTTIANVPKGLSGYITPSNPDLDNGTFFRWYQLSFTGNDAGGRTLNLSRYTMTNSSGAISSSTYGIGMTSADQQQIYTNMGNLGSSTGQLDSMSVRRQTVNRVWYSLDGSSNKRLHMGVYNTNGTGQITIANGFNQTANKGDMFKIYSWTLSDVSTTCTYLGSVSTAIWAPRYFCPLTSDWVTLYVGCVFSNDIIMTLNASTGLYQYQNTMPYIAARLFKDKDGRWCTQVYDGVAITNNGYNSNYIDVVTSDVGQTISITTTATSFVYTGTTVSSSIQVNVYNYLGNRVAKSVSLSVVGQTANPGITFGDGSYSATVSTSASTDTTVTILLVSAAYAKIVGTVSEV